MSARVIALHVRPAKSDDPQAVDAATGRVGGGIEGDFHVAKAQRSVLVLDRTTLDAHGLQPGELREQITIEGLRDVTTLEPGTLVRIGGLTLRVNGPAAPCTHIGEVLGIEDREAFRQSLEGRRGAACTVVEASAPVRVGDPVEVVVPVA